MSKKPKVVFPPSLSRVPSIFKGYTPKGDEFPSNLAASDSFDEPEANKQLRDALAEERRLDEALRETAEVARSLLFNKDGTPKGEDNYAATWLLHNLIRPTRHFSIDGTSPGFIIKHRDGFYRYESMAVQEQIEKAKTGDQLADKKVCLAAATLLDATGSIGDPSLRDYVIGRLTGMYEPKKGGRGRDPLKNIWRDSCISGWLIPPLMQKGFRATRNEATQDHECACSIVSQALSQVGINLSEKAIATVWAKESHRFDSDGNPL